MTRISRLVGLCAVAALFCAILVKSSYHADEAGQTTSTGRASVLLSSAVVQRPVVRVPASDESVIPEADLPGLFALADQLWDRQFPESDDTASGQPAEKVATATPAAAAARKTMDGKKTSAGNYREVTAVVTAYCPCSRCCGKGAEGITSRGKSAWSPGLAADPQAVPYGTRVFVPGYGQYTIDDTGGAMRRSWRRDGRIHIDIRMTYHWQAKEWGRRLMKIRIYSD